MTTVISYLFLVMTDDHTGRGLTVGEGVYLYHSLSATGSVIRFLVNYTPVVRAVR